MAEQETNFYEFGRFRLDTNERILRRDRELVPLTPKVFDILLALVERGGHIVEKDDLMKRVWPDTFVEEGNLTQNYFKQPMRLRGSANESEVLYLNEVVFAFFFPGRAPEFMPTPP